MALRPGDPSPTDFDPAEAVSLADRAANAAAIVLGDEPPGEALILGSDAY